MAPVQYVVRWPGCPSGEEPLVVRYFRDESASSLEEMRCKIKLNMKVQLLPQGTKLSILRRVVDFTPDYAEAIEAERRRVRKEEARARRHNGSRRRTERKQESKQEKQEKDEEKDDETKQMLRKELADVQSQLNRLKLDLNKMDDELMQ